MKTLTQRDLRKWVLGQLYRKELGLSEVECRFDTGDSKENWVGTDYLRGLDVKESNINKKILQVTKHWRLGRMNIIDLCLLRMGVFEMLYREPPTPYKVIIDEVVSLAKEFSDTDSPGFVNGILDEVWRRNRVV